MTKTKFEPIVADDVFKIIKKNYKANLDDSMVTHLVRAMDGSNQKQTMVQEYIEKIKLFHSTKQNYLDDLVQQETTGAQLGRGALSVLVGAGIGGAFFLAAKKSSDVGDVVNPAGQAKEAVEGVFAGVIGACFAVAIDKVWKKLDTTQGQIDSKQMQKDIHDSGLHDDRYKKLSAGLVKLFHFRESLLTNHDELRASFSQLHPDLFDTPCPPGVTQAEIFNLAIEVYFLQALNQLFKDEFNEIYKIHDAVIESDKHSIFGWIKVHLASQENRQQFTQQMQVEFMNTCVKFLQDQMNEHSLMREHIYLMDTFLGLVAGAIALGVTVLVFPLVLAGYIGISLLFACIGVVTSHVTISKVDALSFKRTKANRDGLLTAIQDIERESERLAGLMRDIVMTSDADLNELRAF